MNSFKQRCIELRKQNYTLPEIARITGRSKSSIHFHIHTLPLSATKLRQIRDARKQFARRLGAKRRGVSSRAFNTFSEWNNNKVRLVAHLLFDGEIKHSGCVYNNRNTSLLDLVKHDMQEIYALPPRPYFNKKTGVSRISYFNVSLASYVRTKASELLAHVASMTMDLKREFLKAFFDDEGYVDFRPYRNHRLIRGYQKNVKVLKIIEELLSDFGIEAYIQLPNEVVIRGKKNLERFQKEIGFSPGVRINGKRSNSIWKQSLEKREILRRAIASYKDVGTPGVHRKS